MRNVARLMFAAVLAVAFVASADAQNRRQGQGQRQGGGMGGFGQFSVYSVIVTQGFGQDAKADVNKALKEELKISDEQKDKLLEVMKPINEKRRELFPRGQQQTDEQRKEAAEKRAKLDEDAKKAIEEVLKPEQAKRLGQINYQMMGIRAYANKDVETALKLTDDQKDQIKAILETYGKDVGELRQGAPRVQFGQRPSEEDQKKLDDIRKKTEALTKETEEKVSVKLTDEQKKLWKDMTGEKFDTSKLNPFGGGQRPRRDN